MSNVKHQIFNVQKGFTLIEISIVISILAIISTAGLASFVNYSRNQALQSSANELVTTLNLAKSRAFSQVKPPNMCAANQQLDGYKVLILINGTGYDFYAVCSGNPRIDTTRSVTFPANITVSADASCTSSYSFFYPVISGGVVGNGCVVLSGYNQKKIITVDSIGIVK